MSSQKNISILNNASMNEISSFEKAVMSNLKQSIQKHLSHMKLDQQQLNYSLFLSISNYRTDEHSDQCFLMLLRHKANPNCEISIVLKVTILDFQTPLIAACQKGHVSLVKLLIEYNAKPDLPNSKNEYPLEKVLFDRRENYDVAQALIHSLPTVNIEIKGKMPIIITVERQFLRIFQMLIEKGAALTYETENILHIILKKKFKSKNLKKKFVNLLAGRSFLIQEDIHQKFPFQYEENQEIKNYCIELFKPKILPKQQSITPNKLKIQKIKQANKTSVIKEIETNIKEKDSKKKCKELDGSFSELDEEQYNQDKQHIQNEEKLTAVIQSFDEEQKNEDTIQEKQSQKKQIDCDKVKSKGKDLYKPKQFDQKCIQKEKQVLKNSISQNKILLKHIKQEQNTFKIENTKKSIHQSYHYEAKKKVNKQKLKTIKKLSNESLLKRKNSNSQIISSALDDSLKNYHPNKSYEKVEQNMSKSLRSNTTSNLNKLRKEKQEKLQKLSDEQSQVQSDIEQFQNLNQQILDYTMQISIETQKITQTIKEAIIFLQDMLKNFFNQFLQSEIHLQILVYGSRSTGLAVKHSDLDLLIVSSLDYSYMMKILEEKKVFEYQGIESIKFIHNAFMPVIKLSMGKKFEQLKIDLTFHMKNHLGLRCSELLQEFLHVEPLIKPLVLFLKTLVHIYHLSDPYTGGIGSYSITLLVIALLQSTSRSKTEEELSNLLLDFFYFYGQQLKYISQAVIIYPPNYHESPVFNIYQLPLSSAPSSSENLIPKLIIYDPLNPVNNVSRSSYRIKSIKRLFSVCYCRLKLGATLEDLIDGAFEEIIHDDGTEH